MTLLRTLIYIPLGMTVLAVAGIAYLAYLAIVAATAFYEWVMQDYL